MTKSVSYRLREAAAPIWEKCLNHPFVQGIGDGTLDVEKFQYFMLQDYLYLFDYAKVFAVGVVKARDPELMRTFSKNVDSILNGEMKIHRAYMARLGITEQQVFEVKPALDNTSYTNYMLSAAHAGGPAEIVASILACSWRYASEDYAKTNQALIELMDELAGNVTEKEFQVLSDIFVNCSRYELGFWDMAWEMRV